MNNKLIIGSIFLIAMIVSFSCCEQSSTDKKHEIILYRRDMGGNNGFTLYGDDLIITNYQSGTMTVNDFYKIAKNYIDTVRASFPVSSILFMGKGPCDKLPDPDTDNEDEQKKYYLLFVVFNNGLKENVGRQVAVTYISIWKNGEWVMHDKNRSDEQRLDSLLKSTEPFDNGF